MLSLLNIHSRAGHRRHRRCRRRRRRRRHRFSFDFRLCVVMVGPLCLRWHAVTVMITVMARALVRSFVLFFFSSFKRAEEKREKKGEDAGEKMLIDILCLQAALKVNIEAREKRETR